VLRRRAPKKLRFRSIDKLMLAQVCRCSPSAYKALAIVNPETVAAGIALDCGHIDVESQRAVLVGQQSR
jgi:hypothetical protein